MTHLARIHSSRFVENDLINVNLFGSTFAGLPKRELRNHHEIVRARERALREILERMMRGTERQLHHHGKIEPRWFLAPQFERPAYGLHPGERWSGSNIAGKFWARRAGRDTNGPP